MTWREHDCNGRGDGGFDTRTVTAAAGVEMIFQVYLATNPRADSRTAQRIRWYRASQTSPPPYQTVYQGQRCTSITVEGATLWADNAPLNDNSVTVTQFTVVDYPPTPGIYNDFQAIFVL